MRVAILVVLYNKELSESKSIQSLLKISNNFLCLIFNNGPKSIDCNILHSSSNFEYDECLNNKPLSMIYNDFIKKYNDFDRYVILDDDSILSNSFIERLFSVENYDLELPKIFDTSGILYYPLKNWSPIEPSCVNLDYKSDSVFSIGSGLIIGINVVDKFKQKKINMFNESFAFYGVDFSIFWELHKRDFGFLKITSKSSLIHDMSLHGEVSDFKLSELYINFALQMRHYPSVVNFKNFSYSFLQTLKKMNLKITLSMIFAYITAKHPRCKNEY